MSSVKGVHILSVCGATHFVIFVICRSGIHCKELGFEYLAMEVFEYSYNIQIRAGRN